MPFYDQVSDHFQNLGAKIYFYKINAWEPTEQMEYCKTTWNINGVPQFKAFFNKQIVLDNAGGGDFNMLYNLFSQAIDNTFRIHGVKI
jgi:hypothetical protein